MEKAFFKASGRHFAKCKTIYLIRIVFFAFLKNNPKQSEGVLNVMRNDS